MPQKHIFFVHGRNTKPEPAVLRRLVRRALSARLERVDSDAARLFESPAIKFTVAYYGDLMNDLMVRANPELRQSMIWRGDKWYEPHQRDASHLEQLLSRPSRRHTERDYKDLAREFKNPRFWNEVARVLGPVGSITGLTSYAISRLFPDFGTYLNSRIWASNIRARLQGRLKRALARGDHIALIAHSMGCVVSYDVLWKLSRMDEHRTVRDRKVSLWLTLGCPLGERSIRNELYDAYEPDDGLYPANIGEWVNVAAHYDFVAHDGTVADDFREMRDWKLVDRIRDLPRIYTFWIGSKGSNPHKSYGYLNHPTVARVLARWIKQ
ncbi:MAG: hypothetical protein JSW71_04180 [Gemmatimonadota bacterium]|nr:MAG: hypothetical protein JSW71_04180 [Gemmatimonadota bacterium]